MISDLIKALPQERRGALDRVAVVTAFEKEVLCEILQHLNSIRESVKEANLYWDSDGSKAETERFLADEEVFDRTENEIGRFIDRLMPAAELDLRETVSEDQDRSLINDIFS